MTELKATRTVSIHLKLLVFFMKLEAEKDEKAVGFQQWDKATHVAESFFFANLIFVNMFNLMDNIS
jgi:VanZ family protein